MDVLSRLKIDCSDVSDESDDVELPIAIWRRLHPEEAAEIAPKAEEVVLKKVEPSTKARRGPRRRKPSVESLSHSSENDLPQQEPRKRQAAKKRVAPRRKVRSTGKKPTLLVRSTDAYDPNPPVDALSRKIFKKTASPKRSAHRRSARLRNRIEFAESSQSLDAAENASLESKPGQDSVETLLDTPPFAPDDSPLADMLPADLRIGEPKGSGGKVEISSAKAEPTTELDDLFFSAGDSPKKKPPPRKSKRIQKTMKAPEGGSQGSGESTLLADDSLWG